MKRIEVRVPDYLHQRLVAEAKQAGYTLAGYVRGILTNPGLFAPVVPPKKKGKRK